MLSLFWKLLYTFGKNLCVLFIKIQKENWKHLQILKLWNNHYEHSGEYNSSHFLYLYL